MTEGFILLHRKIKDNWLWKRSDYLHWFLYFLFLANFKDNDKYLFEGEFITVKRGQFITSYRLLAKSLPKCSEQKIRTFIQLLIKDNVILIKSLKKATQITILNYDSYQSHQHSSNTVATQQQHDSNTVATTIERKKKKDNNENNKVLDFKNLKKETWLLWSEYKKTQFKFTYKSKDSEQIAINQLIKLSNNNDSLAIKIINNSISQGYKGLFELKTNGIEQTSPKLKLL